MAYDYAVAKLKKFVMEAFYRSSPTLPYFRLQYVNVP